MAAIDLSPSINVQPALSTLKVQQQVPTDFHTPTFDELYRGSAETNAAVAEANQRKIKAEQRARQLQSDESFNTLPEIDRQEVLSYQRKYGAVPRTVDGSPDIEKIRQNSEEDARMIRGNFKMAAAMSGLQYHQGMKVNPQTGQPEEVMQMIDPSTLDVIREKFLGTTPMKQTTSSGRGGFTDLQRATVKDQLTSKYAILDDIGNMQGLVNDPNINPVGTVAGSWAGRFAGWVESLFGDDGKINSQRNLEQFLNRQAIDLVQYMKGQLSDRDVKFLQAAIPKLKDNEAVWNEWFDKLKALYERRIADTEQALKDGVDVENQPLSPETAALLDHWKLSASQSNPAIEEIPIQADDGSIKWIPKQ